MFKRQTFQTENRVKRTREKWGVENFQNKM